MSRTGLVRTAPPVLKSIREVSHFMWNLLERVVQTCKTVYLWGPPGVGKTFTALSLLGEGSLNLTCTEDLSVQEALGMWIPGPQGFIFRLGPLAESLKRGFGLVVNELGNASSPLQEAFLGILDGSPLLLPSGETIWPHPKWRCVATSNTPPSDLPLALEDRWEVVVHLPTPNPRLLDLVSSRNPLWGQVLRRSWGDPERGISPRRVLSVISLEEQGFSREEAVSLSFGENLAGDILALARMLEGGS